MPIPSPNMPVFTESPPVDVYASEREDGTIWRIEAGSGDLTVAGQ
ncbi:MAG TPA: hypothetical protein VNY55_18715 [Mycobacterium sp.]|jgi:hypothetical protein|nr:hypothetical protein [Mycobacterium sp.]